MAKKLSVASVALGAGLGLVVVVALTAHAANVVDEEILAVSLAGEEVGTTRSKEVADKSGITLTRSESLTVKRGKQQNHMESTTTTTLSPTGAPLHYRYTRKDAAGTFVSEGRIENNTLKLRTTQNGATVENQTPLPPSTTFSTAVDRELRAQLKDGMSIKRSVILEELGAVVEVTGGVKKTADGFTITTSFQGITTTTDVDAQGRTRVSRTPAVSMVLYPPGRAPADVGQGSADLLRMSTWTTRAVQSPAARVRYRVHAPDAANFVVPEDARQKIVARTATTIDVEVKAGASSTAALKGAARKRLLSSTPYEAVDDARIQKAAADAVAGKKTPREQVSALVHFVDDHVANKSLDRGYAPAIATLESGTGDCTEHSVLLSALLRARGFPTRIVEGVVVDGTHAGYHEWIEVYLDGEGFVAADPTFGQFPAGPERLKLAEGSTLPDDQLPIILAASRLLTPGVSVEVLDSTPAP